MMILLIVDSKKLKSLIVDFGDNIRDFAYSSKISEATIFKLLRRDRPAQIKTVARLANTLGVDKSLFIKG